MMSNITSTIKRSEAPSVGRSLALSSALKRGALGGLLAVAGNLLVYALARFAFGQELLMPPIPPATESAPLLAFAVIFASFIPALGAGLVYWLLAKFTSAPRRIFLIVSVVFLLLSFAGPFTLPVTLATQLVLNLMHIVAGAAIVGALTR